MDEPIPSAARTQPMRFEETLQQNINQRLYQFAEDQRLVFINLILWSLPFVFHEFFCQSSVLDIAKYLISTFAKTNSAPIVDNLLIHTDPALFLEEFEKSLKVPPESGSSNVYCAVFLWQSSLQLYFHRLSSLQRLLNVPIKHAKLSSSLSSSKDADQIPVKTVDSFLDPISSAQPAEIRNKLLEVLAEKSLDNATEKDAACGVQTISLDPNEVLLLKSLVTSAADDDLIFLSFATDSLKLMFTLRNRRLWKYTKKQAIVDAQSLFSYCHSVMIHARGVALALQPLPRTIISPEKVMSSNDFKEQTLAALTTVKVHHQSRTSDLKRKNKPYLELVCLMLSSLPGTGKTTITKGFVNWVARTHPGTELVELPAAEESKQQLEEKGRRQTTKKTTTVHWNSITLLHSDDFIVQECRALGLQAKSVSADRPLFVKVHKAAMKKFYSALKTELTKHVCRVKPENNGKAITRRRNLIILDKMHPPKDYDNQVGKLTGIFGTCLQKHGVPRTRAKLSFGILTCQYLGPEKIFLETTSPSAIVAPLHRLVFRDDHDCLPREQALYIFLSFVSLFRGWNPSCLHQSLSFSVAISNYSDQIYQQTPKYKAFAETVEARVKEIIQSPNFVCFSDQAKCQKEIDSLAEILSKFPREEPLSPYMIDVQAERLYEALLEARGP